ncbi:MAG: serine hydrolase [Clostridium sp.]|nr:serine hydrolase [Clostridium sp.]
MRKKFIKSISLLLAVAITLPFATNVSAAEPDILGVSALVMDMDTGEVIYSKNADDERSPASTTKLLTSLIFAENKKKSDLIAYSENSANLTETSLNAFISDGVKVGDTISADDVMKAVMIYSANDASVMMAESVAGSVDAFSDMMNKKAKELGAVNSHFINPNGLEVNSTTYNVTTAYDLALISTEAFKIDWIRDVMAEKSTSVSLDGTTILIDTRNKILGQNGNVGGKTGTEEQAGHCFIGFFQKNGRNLVTVVLGSQYGVDGTNVFNDTLAIANYGYTAEETLYKEAGSEVGTVTLNYKLFRFLGPTKQITVPIVLSDDVDYYHNDFNEEHAEILYTSKETNAWKLTGNKSVDLTLKIGEFEETVKGTISLTTGTLLKASLPIYGATLLFAAIVIVLIVILARVINMSRSKNRRNRYYR